MLKLIRRLPVHIFLLALGFIWVYPFIWMISASFKTTQELFNLDSVWKLIPASFQFQNYFRAWTVANFSGYFFNTVIVTCGTVLLVLVISSTSGYVFGRYNFPGKKILMVLLIVTMFIPSGYTVIPVFDLMKRLHLLNSLAAVILAETGGGHVLYIFMFTGFFAGLPKELEESARIDGAGFFTVFSRIMLPLSAPIVATVSIFQFMDSWNAFFNPLIFTLGRPELRTLGVGMFAFTGEHSFDWTGATAAASISLIPVIIVFLIFQKLFINGVVGAIKG
ncbi:MAG: carbohydrate ABC transporter permease [Firmicutes bacterium]|nr:carbohydrate ABC transporter permease [Bacillota bacterium]